ncbi:MAG: hypothetical protein E7426_05535 [Ruminococcaceae bacterium]|jgi:hypothetical protein|nr:hypothetical protein [Oscillospiraceae bacterium]
MDKMEFTLGNTQEEAPKRVEEKPKKKKTLLLVIVAAVALLAVLAAVLWDANSFDGLRRRIIYARAQKDENGCAELYGYSAERTSRFAALDGSLLIASPNQIRLVDEEGKVRYEGSIRFQSCGIAAREKLAAVYDIGGTDIYVMDSRGLVRQMTAEGTILSVTLNEKGYLAVTVNGSGYKASVNVYDDQGAPVFTFHSADRFAMTATVSRDCRSVAAVTMGEADGVFASRVVTYRLNSTEPDSKCDLSGGAVYDIGTVDRSFCAVAEDALHFLSASGALQDTYSFGGDSLRRCDLKGDGFAALLLGHYKSGSQCRLVTVDGEGQEIASLEVSSDVVDLSVTGRYVAALYSDHMTIYDRHLQECATLDDVSAVRQVMMRADGSAVLAGISSAHLYLP